MNASAPRPAKLTAGLLARKGAAAPAALGSLSAAPARATPAPANGTPAARRTAPGPSRLTLRLDERRHLRLKLTAAHLQKSLQAVLCEALDRYLDQVSPEMLSNNCVCLATQSPAHAGKRET